jgi:hypothetical protein
MIGMNGLLDFENAERVGRILQRKNMPEKTDGLCRLKRKFSDRGFPYVLASEIHANPENNLTERETITALNILVKKKQVKIENSRGYLWYVWVG